MAGNDSDSGNDSRSQELVVRNTFLTVVDVPDHSLRRSQSDGILDSSSDSRSSGGSRSSSHASRVSSFSSDEEGAQGSDMDGPKSVGSFFHGEGCKPCRFTEAKKDCPAGRSCKFCHEVHDKVRGGKRKAEKRAKKEAFAAIKLLEAGRADRGSGSSLEPRRKDKATAPASSSGQQEEEQSSGSGENIIMSL